VLGYIVIVLVVCLTTATIALFCSVMFRKTSISLMTSYLVIALLFAAPLAVTYFANTFFYDTRVAQLIANVAFTSPFAAAFQLPIDLMMPGSDRVYANWAFFGAFVGFYAMLDGGLLWAMGWLFNVRWRMA
jgi:hypothetical protein